MRPSNPRGTARGDAQALAELNPIRDARSGATKTGTVEPAAAETAAVETGMSETRTSGRRKAVIALAIGAFLLLALLVAQASFNLKFISPDSNQQLFFFVTLTGLIFFVFVALSLVLGRNLLKLYAERRQGVAGSKFRTRLVVVNLLLSFLPVIAMFWFSYGLMNRSIDKWFSQPVEEVRTDTAAMSALLYDYAGENAASEAQSLARSEEF
jgi:two-component system, NtrC family, nitrogen regulation sensor histidine kinase NtrY